MVAIANVWVSAALTRAPSASTTAYADNWTWWSAYFADHQFLLQHTVSFCNILGLQIDWNKTWVWSTKTKGEISVANLIEQQAGEKVDIQRTATDLGCPLSYHGNNLLGTLRDRLQEAKNRLMRIQRSSWPLEVKIHIIASSIYPLAFYGCEFTVVGISHLKALRTQIVYALLGEKSQSASSAIFLQFAIVAALKQAQRYLWRCSPAKRFAFLQTLATPKRTTGLAQGPATALREYLLRIDFLSDPMAIFGFLTLTRSTLSLYTGFKTLKPLLLQAWQEQFLVSHTQRKSLFNLPSVDRISTLQILKKYHNKERLLLLREISGAFQTKVQQASWDESTDVLCPWCQAAPDTRHHRLSTCAALSDTREPFQSLVTELIDENSHLVDLPVVFCEPDLHYIRSVHTAMPEATIPTEVIRSLRIRHGSQPFSCYTDGSCQAPACVMSRYSAYAIIADLYVNDQERMDQVRLYASTGVIPPTLQLVGAARLTGAQNIHRAKNLAVIKCFEAIPEAIIYIY